MPSDLKNIDQKCFWKYDISDEGSNYSQRIIRSYKKNLINLLLQLKSPISHARKNLIKKVDLKRNESLETIYAKLKENT